MINEQDGHVLICSRASGWSHEAISQLSQNYDNLSRKVAQSAGQAEPRPAGEEPSAALDAFAPVEPQADGKEIAAASPVAQIEMPTEGYHTIAPGDTFDKLSRLYGITVEQIKAANPDVAPRRIQIGQRIYLDPETAPQPPAPEVPAAETPAPEQSGPDEPATQEVENP